MGNINAVIQSFCCPNWVKFFNKTSSLERHSGTCSERVGNIYPRNVYKIRKPLFDKLDSSAFKYEVDQKLFRTFAIFDLESVCVPYETFMDTNTTMWIGKHVTISVLKSSNLSDESVFLCNSDLHHLFTSFVGAPKNLAAQNKTKTKTLFLDTERTIKIKLGSIKANLTQRRYQREQVRRFDMKQDDCENKNCASTQFLQIQKTQLIELQECMELFHDALPVFGFNSPENDFSLSKSYLLPILVNGRDI